MRSGEKATAPFEPAREGTQKASLSPVDAKALVIPSKPYNEEIVK